MAELVRGHEPAARELLSLILEKGRAIVFAGEGSDDLRYLDAKAANANVGGATLEHILVREDVRTIEVLEDFLHGT